MIAAVERAVARLGRAPELRLFRWAPGAPARPKEAAPGGAAPPPKKRLQHSLKLDATFAVVLLLATGITFIAFRYIYFLEASESFVDDVRTATFTPAEPQHPDIVIAALTEDTLAQFPYRSPVNRAFLAKLLKTLDEHGARLIALDVLFDQATEPENDELLRQTILGLKTPLIVTYADNVSGQMTDDQQEYLDNFLPPRFRALGNLATDKFDDTVRRVHPGHPTKDGTFVPGFARAVAARLGIETPPDEVQAVWRGRPAKEVEPFAEWPAHLITQVGEQGDPVFPVDEWVKGKIVLIGAEYTLVDRHRTPFKVVYEQDKPGIVIHAHAVAQFLAGKTERSIGTPGQILIVGGFAAIGMVLGALHLHLWLRVGATVAAIAALWAFGWLGVLHLHLPAFPLVMPTMSFGLAMWMTDTVTGREARQQKEFIQGAFSRMVSPKVVDELIADPSKLSIGGERRDMTFIFTDIAGFTTLSESVESKTLSMVLNKYLDEACAIILKYDGMVDKFIGDAIMAIFNAPTSLPAHEQQAVRCAIELDAFAERFRLAQVAAGIPMGVTRIGVHTGEATGGMFGSTQKMEYTALGDTVNTASRLEGINKFFGTRVCVSEATRAKCDFVPFRPLAFIRPKGKLTSLGIYEPLDEERARSDYIRRYEEAYRALEHGDGAAIGLLEALHEEDPGDKTVALHLKNAKAGHISTEVIMEEK